MAVGDFDMSTKIGVDLKTVQITLDYSDAIVLMTLLKGLAQIARADPDASKNGVLEAVNNVRDAIREVIA